MSILVKGGSYITFGAEETFINLVEHPKVYPNGFRWDASTYVIDTETQSLDAKFNLNDELHYIGVVNAISQEYVVFEEVEEFIEWENSLDDPYFIFHNAAFDVSVLRLRGARIENYFDTAVASAIWKGGSAENFSLDKLSSKLGYTKLDLRKALVDKGILAANARKGHEYYFKSPEMMTYLVFDLNATLAVYADLGEKYSQDQKAFNYLVSIELPYIERIIEMQSGVHIDREKLREVQASFRSDLSNAYKRLQDFLESSGMFVSFDGVTYVPAPTKANREKTKGSVDYVPFSPTNVSHNMLALSKLYGWEPTNFTAKDNPQLTKYELEELEAEGNEFVSLILELRTLEKLLGTFVEGIKASTYGDVLYPDYCQICTRTHRLSSKNP